MKNIFGLIICCFISGCKLTERVYESAEFYIILPNTCTPKLSSGDIKVIHKRDDNSTVHLVSFDQVRGGFTTFLGIMVRESSGHNVKRLEIKCGIDDEADRFSISDLNKLKVYSDTISPVDILHN